MKKFVIALVASMTCFVSTSFAFMEKEVWEIKEVVQDRDVCRSGKDYLLIIEDTDRSSLISVMVGCFSKKEVRDIKQYIEVERVQDIIGIRCPIPGRKPSSVIQRITNDILKGRELSKERLKPKRDNKGVVPLHHASFLY